jgi:hypothetical protein
VYRVIVFIVITTCLEFQLEVVPLRREGWKTSSSCDPCNCGDDLVDPEMLNLADRRLASVKDLIEYGKRDFCTTKSFVWTSVSVLPRHGARASMESGVSDRGPPALGSRLDFKRDRPPLSTVVFVCESPSILTTH